MVFLLKISWNILLNKEFYQKFHKKNILRTIKNFIEKNHICHLIFMENSPYKNFNEKFFH